MTDVIYPVRPGQVNEELRYSLRSLSNMAEVGTVWVVGDKPAWLTGVEFVPGNLSSSGHANVYQNILTACRIPDVSDEVLIFNDDFFVTDEVTVDVPQYYRSTLAEHLALPRLRSGGKSWWRESLLTTQVCLQAVGKAGTLSYELHVPFPANRHLLRDTLERFAEVTPANPPQWRSLYGNLHVDPADAVKRPDSKAFAGGKLGSPFHSTTDLSWRHYRTQMTKMFPEPSGYERVTEQTRIRG